MDHPTPLLRAAQKGFRWDAVTCQPYKQDGSAPFKDISRQVLFREDSLGCELRYFEIEANGYSTLERHEHAHAVMILRGQGECLLGEDVRQVKPLDLVSIPAWTWHQFQAGETEPLGFLCMVNVQRDRPQLPDPQDLATLRQNPVLATFLDRGAR